MSSISEHSYRIGIGFDVHRLVEGRPLVMGGVVIPFEKGLLGHSDADVLIHVIIDALLGAADMGDIGALFPDTDAAYKDIESTKLLRICCEKLAAAGWKIINVDSVIACQRPKILPHVPAMRRVLSEITGCAQITVKGKTTEGLGFEGAGEGISARAVALISR